MSWLWAAWLAAAPVAPGWQHLDEVARAQLVESLAAQTLPERLKAVSSRFMTTPYVTSPLGEGEGQDPDPRIRFDAVDCLTFVEETMALSLVTDFKQVLPTLDAIRYGGAVSYGHRNHVMEAQWLPHNVAKGYLLDVARQYGGERTRTVTKTLDDTAWASKSGRGLELSPADQARGQFAVDLIPAAKALEVLKRVPEGTIVVVVRADRPQLVTRITHVGFLVQTRKGPALRHASRTFGKVVDEPLSNYLERNLGYAKWTVEGFGLYQVSAPRPR